MTTRVGALLLSAVLMAGCGGHAADPPSGTDCLGCGLGIPGTTTADNVATARAESEHLLTVLRPPQGGRVVQNSPVADLRDQLEGVSPSDSKLSRHAWWTVPMTPSAFAAWLRSQHVPGTTVGDGGASSAPDGSMVDILELDGTSTSAYSAPVVTFAYLAHDGGVAVRLDTFLAARYARTTSLPTDVSRIAIRVTTRDVRSSSRAHVRATSITDAATVSRMVAAANRLAGIVTVPNVFHCPLILTVKTYAVSFTTPSGTWTISGPATVCGAVLTLEHDGRRVPPALDPGRTWFPLVDGVLAQG